MLSGEIQISRGALESITTEHYRTTDHPHLATVTAEHRASAIDIAGEFRTDASFLILTDFFEFETTYDVFAQSDTGALVIARIILVEKKEGNREKALDLPELPRPYRDVIRDGLELPFRFRLVKEGSGWKIDEITVPDVLLPLMESADKFDTPTE